MCGFGRLCGRGTLPRSPSPREAVMRILSAIVLLAFGVGPVAAQSAPLKDEPRKRAEDERKLAEERAKYAREMEDANRKLQLQLEVNQRKLKLELEAKARELQALRDQAAEDVKRKAEGPKPGQPVEVRVLEAVRTATAPSDPAAALRPLTKSGDPKVAALAGELLERLTKSPPAVAARLVPGMPQLTPPKPGEPFKMVVVTDGSKNVKAPEASSSLRMSADGKTAAVIAADGSVTVFDTASGKELMRFPVKK